MYAREQAGEAEARGALQQDGILICLALKLLRLDTEHVFEYGRVPCEDGAMDFEECVFDLGRGESPSGCMRSDAGQDRNVP